MWYLGYLNPWIYPYTLYKKGLDDMTKKGCGCGSEKLCKEHDPMEDPIYESLNKRTKKGVFIPIKDNKSEKPYSSGVTKVIEDRINAGYCTTGVSNHYCDNEMCEDYSNRQLLILNDGRSSASKEFWDKLDKDSQSPIPVPYCYETKEYYDHIEREHHTTGAQKEIAGKLRMDLIPPEVETALAEVLTFGAEKYSDRNWEKGLQFEKHHLAAMYRHVNKWRRRIDNDEESGLNHIKHAMWHLMAIITQIERGRTDLDDRGIVE